MNKKKLKQHIKKCAFCKETESLDIHRIEEGKFGGKYKKNNTIVVCCNCHRKIHLNIIKNIKKLFSTTGNIILYQNKDGSEKVIKANH